MSDETIDDRVEGAGRGRNDPTPPTTMTSPRRRRRLLFSYEALAALVAELAAADTGGGAGVGRRRRPRRRRHRRRARDRIPTVSGAAKLAFGERAAAPLPQGVLPPADRGAVLLAAQRRRVEPVAVPTTFPPQVVLGRPALRRRRPAESSTR